MRLEKESSPAGGVDYRISGLLVGFEHDRVEDDACLSHQLRIDRLVDISCVRAFPPRADQAVPGPIGLSVDHSAAGPSRKDFGFHQDSVKVSAGQGFFVTAAPVVESNFGHQDGPLSLP